MKFSELTSLSRSELIEMLGSLQKSLFSSRLNAKLSADSAKQIGCSVRSMRRDIARIYTILNSGNDVNLVNVRRV